MNKRTIYIHTWISSMSVFFTLFAASLVGMYIHYVKLTQGSNLSSDLGNKYWSLILYLNIKILMGYIAIATLLAMLIVPILLIIYKRRQQHQKEMGIRFIYAFTSIVVLGMLILVVHYKVQHDARILIGFTENMYYFVQDRLPAFVWNLMTGNVFWMITCIWGILALAYHIYLLVMLAKDMPGLSRRRVVTAIAILTGCLGIVISICLYYPPKRELPILQGRPNIIFIGSDSLRWDYLSCNGYPRSTTPNIDALALEGINFSNCYAPIASTLESFVSLFNSQYPQTHGIRYMWINQNQLQKVERDSVWLGDILRQKGYENCVVGNWAATDFSLVDMKFSTRLLPHSGKKHSHNMDAFVTEFIFFHHFLFSIFSDVGRFLYPEIESVMMYASSSDITHRTLKLLKRLRQENHPFMMVSFYSRTHLPYGGNPGYNKKFCDPNYRGRNRNKLNFPIDDFIQGNIDFNYSQREIEHIRDLYAANVREFDDCVGKIMEYLKESGLLTNSIVVIFSDHGDDIFEPNCSIGHGISFKGGDQSNRIPMILHLPGQPFGNQKIDKIVRSIDIAPTLLELLGFPPDKSWQGVSLLPYMKYPNADLGLAFYGESSYLFFAKKAKADEDGQQPLHYPGLTETTYVDHNLDSRFVIKDKYHNVVISTKDRCIRTEDYKLIYIPGQCRGHASDQCPTAGRCNPIYKLYDLKKDPRQMHNVFSDTSYKTVADTLCRALWDWIDHGCEARLPLKNGDIIIR